MKPPATQVRVVIADDSAASRELLLVLLSADPEIRVVAMAKDGTEAVEQTVRSSPDVVLMDWQMPGFDGIRATQEIMRRAPCPILMVSSRPDIAGAALDAGAVDFIPKTVKGPVLCATVKLFSRIKVVGQRLGARPSRLSPRVGGTGPYSVIGVGASTGGPGALRDILSLLPRTLPPLAIVQHVSDGFAQALVEWLAATTGFPIELARNGQSLREACAYLAPDGTHLRVDRALGAQLGASELVNSVMPSVDVLFRTLAHHHGRRAIGVLLTGMGRDGASGLLELRRAGGRTIVQDAESSVIDGMPKVARELGAAEWVVPLGEIPAALVRMTQDQPALPHWEGAR